MGKVAHWGNFSETRRVISLKIQNSRDGIWGRYVRIPGVFVCIACSVKTERISVYQGYASLLLRPRRISVGDTPNNDHRCGISAGSILGDAIVCCKRSREKFFGFVFT